MRRIFWWIILLKVVAYFAVRMKTVLEVDQSNLVNFIQYCLDTVYTSPNNLSTSCTYQLLKFPDCGEEWMDMDTHQDIYYCLVFYLDICILAILQAEKLRWVVNCSDPSTFEVVLACSMILVRIMLNTFRTSVARSYWLLRLIKTQLPE